MRCPSCALDNPEGMNFCGRCGTPLRQHCPQCGFENPAEFAFCGKYVTRLTAQMSAPHPQPPTPQPQTPLSYTPRHLAEKILTSRSALEGERKQVTAYLPTCPGSPPSRSALIPRRSISSWIAAFTSSWTGCIGSRGPSINSPAMASWPSLARQSLTRIIRLEMRALEQDEHGYILTPDALQGKIPETIQNVIAARIDRLPEREKRVMQAAAVIGREFPLQLLQKVAEGEHACTDSLQHLQELGLIYDRGFFPERRYLFKHALTQDVAYNSLLTPRRQTLHEAIGGAMEDLYSARLEEHCELLAHHCTRSGNRAKAVPYLSLAGKKAARLFAQEQAIAFFQEALRYLDGLADSEAQKRKAVEILFDLEVLYDLFARRDEQRDTPERLIHSAIALDDPAVLADAYIRQGELLSVVGSTENALVCVEQALNLKRLIGDKRGEAKALRAMGFLYWQRGQYEEALHIHREVLQVYQTLGDRETEGMDLTSLGELLRQLQRYQEALQCLEEALQLLTAIGNLMEIGMCHYNLGNVYRDLGAYETALQHYLKAEDNVVRIDTTSTFFNHAHRAALTSIATTYRKLGNHRDALHYDWKVLEISRKIGDWPDVIATLRRLAVTHEILREFPEALGCYQEALQTSHDLGDRQEERTILATMAHLYRQQLRDFHAALPCYHQSLALWEESGDEAGRLALLKGLGATCWNLGRYEEAATAFEQALHIVEAAGDQAEQATVRSSLGVVLGNLRRYATALTHLQAGLAIALAMADLRAQGYILNALGNVYYEIGNQLMAKDCYQQAVELRRLIRDRVGEGWSCYYLGRAHAEAQELGAAQEYQEQALSLAIETGNAELQARTKIALAALHCRLDNPEVVNRALCYAQEAVALARAHGLHQAESTGLSYQAIALLRLHNVEEALRYSTEAIQQGEKGGKATGEQDMIWLHHARVLRACGRRELADYYLERAYAGVMERLATVRDARVREAMLQTRLLREILAERTTGGQHHAALSD
jgi:tetratricopeptide (TPR) repeat protein